MVTAHLQGRFRAVLTFFFFKSTERSLQCRCFISVRFRIPKCTHVLFLHASGKSQCEVRVTLLCNPRRVSGESRLLWHRLHTLAPAAWSLQKQLKQRQGFQLLFFSCLFFSSCHLQPGTFCLREGRGDNGAHSSWRHSGTLCFLFKPDAFSCLIAVFSSLRLAD